MAWLCGKAKARRAKSLENACTMHERNLVQMLYVRAALLITYYESRHFDNWVILNRNFIIIEYGDHIMLGNIIVQL
jgi:hypothetical protein